MRAALLNPARYRAPGVLPRLDLLRKLRMRRAAPMREFPGRPVGLPEGTWISDYAELRKSICLCWSCHPKFDYRRYHYHKDTRFPYVVSQCDACRRPLGQCKFFIHESRLVGPGRQGFQGSAWIPA